MHINFKTFLALLIFSFTCGIVSTLESFYDFSRNSYFLVLFLCAFHHIESVLQIIQCWKWGEYNKWNLEAFKIDNVISNGHPYTNAQYFYLTISKILMLSFSKWQKVKLHYQMVKYINGLTIVTFLNYGLYWVRPILQIRVLFLFSTQHVR